MRRHIFFLLAMSLTLTLYTSVTTGDARTNLYLPLLKNQRIALMSNHTGLVVDKDRVRKLIMQGKTADEIRIMWQDDVAEFKEQRRPYLLYKE